MDINEAIKHAEGRAKFYREMAELYKEGREPIKECGSTADAYENEQLVSWLNELKRLQSLEAHMDTYEQGGYAFSYHEMSGMCSISAMRTAPNGEWKPLGHYELDGPHSHEWFVAWCKNWIAQAVRKDMQGAQGGRTAVNN